GNRELVAKFLSITCYVIEKTSTVVVPRSLFRGTRLSQFFGCPIFAPPVSPSDTGISPESSPTAERRRGSSTLPHRSASDTSPSPFPRSSQSACLKDPCR